MEKVVYFNRNSKCGYSIAKVFHPIINRMKMNGNISSLEVPYNKISLYNLCANIFFVWKHRTCTGINHVTGDIHYVLLALIGCKSVLTIHDLIFLKKKQNCISFFLKWLFWLYLPVKIASKVICISNKTKDEVLSFVKVRDIEVVYNPVSEIYTPKDKEQFVTLPRILHIGTKENKNLLRVVESLKNIDCILCIIGQINENIKKMLSKNQIIYENKSNLSEEELLKEYRLADIISFPSLYEGFGMPIIEGQAVGIPILTSNIAPMNVISGGAACLVDPYSVLSINMGFNKIISSQNYRNTIVKLGFANVQRFTLLKVVEEYRRIYNAIV